jgi:hypothetical protein
MNVNIGSFLKIENCEGGVLYSGKYDNWIAESAVCLQLQSISNKAPLCILPRLHCVHERLRTEITFKI